MKRLLAVPVVIAGLAVGAAGASAARPPTNFTGLHQQCMSQLADGIEVEPGVRITCGFESPGPTLNEGELQALENQCAAHGGDFETFHFENGAVEVWECIIAT